MNLIILLLITFLNYYSCHASINKVIENVYIDTLVQQYLSDENFLWDTIYQNNGSGRDAGKILSKIQDVHNQFYYNNYLNIARGNNYSSKFLKHNMDFNNVQTNVEKHANEILNPTLQQGVYKYKYMDVDMTFSALNFTQALELFGEINVNSISPCKTWSTQMESNSLTLYMFYEMFLANLFTSYIKSQEINMEQVIKNKFDQHDHDVLRTQFKDMYNKLNDVARVNIRTASRITWMCDKNATLDRGDSQEITNFIRGYVDNQINLNSEKSCWGSCSDYTFTKNYGCYNGTFCYDQIKVGEADPICRGTIFDCGFIEEEMEICPSLDHRNRRYEYINYGCTPTHRHKLMRCNDEGRYFGHNNNCEAKRKTLKSFRNEWLMKCDYCFCYCDEHQLVNSDRYFSLREVVSDVKDNMIVTGVEISKRHGMFSFTITQSRLLPNGRVEPNYADVKNFVDFRRSDVDIHEGIDYHRLSWENRSVNLDTIILPQGCVVTGVKFVLDKDQHLGIAVRSTTIDFNTGTLLDLEEWIGSGYRDRTNLIIKKPEPNRYYDIYGAYLSVPDFKPDMFVKFRPSDPDKDAGQTTVPFIDTQLVRPDNLIPLSGVGLYYKGKPGLGGFIAPSIVVYDMSPYIGKNLYATTTPEKHL